jgi:colicin import membrane protein
VPSSANAVEAARDQLRRRGLEAAASASGGEPPQVGGERRKGDDGRVNDDDATGVLPRGATTNDLAEAARREQAIAQQQFAVAQLQSQQRPSEQQAQQEEAARAQRQRQHQEEIQRHQLAVQQAAERRAAEEALQRERLLASLSPQELAQAAELQAQQKAVGALVFGTQSASEAAGLVHQANAQKKADEATAAGLHVDVAQLVNMSPEQLAEWDFNHDPYA